MRQHRDMCSQHFGCACLLPPLDFPDSTLVTWCSRPDRQASGLEPSELCQCSSTPAHKSIARRIHNGAATAAARFPWSALRRSAFETRDRRCLFPGRHAGCTLERALGHWLDLNRPLRRRYRPSSRSAVLFAARLLSSRGEASALATAGEIIERYERLDVERPTPILPDAARRFRPRHGPGSIAAARPPSR